MNSFIRNRLVQAGTVFTATLLAVGASAPVQAAPGEKAASSQVKPEATKDRRICVRVELTGTRMTRRVCRTAAEWERDGGVPTN